MSLQFIIGNSGAGKSYAAYQNVIREASRNPINMYYVIVPEQFTMQTQKTLVEMHPQKGILNIDVLSFERLAYRIFEEVGGDTRKVLEETGKNMVIQKLVQMNQKKLVYLKNQMKKPGYLDEVKSLISEFMQYEVHEEEMDKIINDAEDKPLLQMKLKDVSVLYQAFREYLSDHFMTSEEVLEVLAKEIPFSRKLRGSTVILDGYTGFTPVQHTVIRELLAVCKKVSVTVTMDVREEFLAKGKPHELFYMSHKMIRSLSEFTKDVEEPVWIKSGSSSRFADSPALGFLEHNLFRYRRRSYDKEQKEVQIAVITGNLEEYGSIARHVFEEAGIPFFIDEKHSVLMNPFVEYVRAALEMVSQGFSYESVFRYLRCGMSDISRSETDRLENYVLALGIHGFWKWDERWVRLSRDMDSTSIMELNVIRERFVTEVRSLAEGFAGKKKTVAEYSRCLYEFIVQSRVQEKLAVQELLFKQHGDRAMEKEYAQIYGIVMNLLDKMVSILGDEKVSAEEYRQLLETGMGQAKVALIPPGIDQVLVGDMERTRLKDIRALFFVGVNEGCIPKNTESGGILTEMDRDFLGGQGVELAPGPKELMNTQRFYLYLNLTKPSERLCLSYSMSNGKGEATGPAFLIRTVQTLFPKLKTKRAEEPQNELELIETPNTAVEYFLSGLTDEEKRKDNPIFAELYSWYLNSPRYCTVTKKLIEAAFIRKPVDQISKSVAKALYGEVSPNGATRLERFSACAFAHFLKYGLEVQERAEYEFKAMDMGNVIHQALEDFAAEIHRRKLKWSELSDELRDAIADECLDKISADYGNTILQSSARNQYMIERTRRILRRTVWALQEQLRNGKFQPEGFEVSIGGGRIDRLDIMKTDDKVYVKIIDYKTGNTTFDLVSIYYGLQMQLVVYMDAAVKAEQRKYPNAEVKPAGIFYYNVKDPMLQKEMEDDLDRLDPEIFKKLKMNGLVLAEDEVISGLDRTTVSLPMAYTSTGLFRKGSSIASENEFALLDAYVKKKITDIREAILDGNAEVSPYEMGNRNACTYCPYQGTCGFDRKIPGYEFRRLKQFADDEIWKAFAKEVDDEWE